jgi:Flp pilus assembly pilin Flp
MKLIKCRKGQGMVEYILLIIIILVVLFAAWKILGKSISGQFTKQAGKIDSADTV